MRPALIPLDKPPVILTGEYIPENFLLSRDGAGWHLAGLIDFGDVMTGWGEYDLLGPERLHDRRQCRGGCGACSRDLAIRAADITPDLKRRLMALMLLHRVSDPVRQICIEGWQQKAADSPNCRLLWM